MATTTDQHFIVYMIQQEVTPEEAQDVAAELAQLGIPSAKTFLGYVAAGQHLHDFWKSIAK